MALSHHNSYAAASSSYTHYDVFLNFRGPDVKNTFASALYRNLTFHGLKVFLDQPELVAGDNFTNQIEAAIKAASVHIAIFSPNYVESRWCLDELVLMVKSRAAIVPVFYHVKPSELRWTGRNKNGAYAEALRKHEERQRYDIQTIENWRSALSDAADISGFELEAFNRDERELLDKVVQRVLRLVPRPQLDVAKYPIGLAEKTADFEKTVLSQQGEHSEAKVVGIVGSGGVGKTTLAKEIFNCKRSDYSRSSFLFDVRENAARRGLSGLQSRLIKDLLNIDIQIENTHQGVEMLKRYLSSCHVLIILDDVDHVDQLDSFLPMKCVLHPKSLILVTSRDNDVLIRAGIDCSSIYRLKGLNGPQSRELFCLYAFFQPYPPPGFEDLVDRVLKVCDGLPLSLKVIGAILYAKDKSGWEPVLNSLNQRLPTEIQDRLRISYDSFSEHEKQIFLDIAYFFIGKDRDMAITIWNGSGWNGLAQFQNLQNKFLVGVDNENKITMEQHVQDFGRTIAVDSELMPRRLCYSVEDFHCLHDMLEQSSSGSASIMPTFECVSSFLGFLFKSIFHIRWYDCSSLLKYIHVIPTKVRGIRMAQRPTVEATCDEGSLPLNTSSREEVFGISKLQLLEAEGDFVESILTWVRSPNLLWLRWNECPFSFLPSWIPMKDLRVLEVAGRDLERLWQHKSEAPLQLRELNIDAPLSEFPKSIVQLKHLEKIALTYREIEGTRLVTLPEEFYYLQSLKHLELKRCYKLKILPNSFGNLRNLRHINLVMCKSLQSLPNSFGYLRNLQHIDLSGCKSLRMLPDSFGNLTNLQEINMSMCEILEMLPDNFGNLINLQQINMSMCERLKMLPNSIGNLTHLLQVDLSYCKSLRKLPISLGNLTNLQYINMSVCQSLNILPVSLGNLINLQKINLSFCESLQLLPNSLGNLTNLQDLNLSSCKSLQMLPDSLGNLISLHNFNLSSCQSLQSLPDSLGNLINLQDLNLSSCQSLESLPDSLGNLTSLHNFNLSSCQSLQSLPESFGNLTSLHNFNLSSCQSLQSLPDSLGNLTNLQDLNLSSSQSLQSLPDSLGNLTNLQDLNLSSCQSLQCLPYSLGNLTNLQNLNMSSCQSLQCLPDSLGNLINLHSINLSSCESLQMLPDSLGNLTNLHSINVSSCKSLQILPDTLRNLTNLQNINLS